jgi:hypothetical protein
MSDDLLKEVKDADPKIAARWQARVTGKMDKPVLTPDDIDFIVADLAKQLKTRDITQNEGLALIAITNASIAADSGKSKAGLVRFIYYVNIWDKANRLNLVPLVTSDELLPISDFLRGGIAANISFMSPGTGIIYTPRNYNAVGVLVFGREVMVAISKSGLISEYADEGGSYASEMNIMRLNAATPLSRKLAIVHESTHVIQDWQDVSGPAKYHEADAFIAEAVARRQLTTEPPDGEVEAAALVAADMVIKKTARAGDKTWQTAYGNVVTEVVKRYKNGAKFYDRTRGEKTNEKNVWQQLMKEIDAINEVRDAVNKEVAEQLLKVLP